MTYYSSLMLVLVGMKIVLLLLLVGPWLWGKLWSSRFGFAGRLRQRGLQQRISAMEDQLKGRRRASIAHVLQSSLGTLQKEVVAVDWVKVFKASFMLLFVAYPGAEWDSGAEPSCDESHAVVLVRCCYCRAASVVDMWV